MVSNLVHCISCLEPTLSCRALIRPWRGAEGKTVMVETFNEGDSRRAKGFWHFIPCAPGGWLLGQLARRTAGQSTSQTAGQAASQPSGGVGRRFFSLWSESQTEVGRGAGEFPRSGASLGWQGARSCSGANRGCHTSGFWKGESPSDGGQSAIYLEEMMGDETVCE